MTVPISSGVLHLIGNTPLVRLKDFEEAASAAIYAKLESFNPSGSVKDRVCLAMIEDAESKGMLKPGSVVIEPTTGNTGMGLALVCAVKGYRLVLAMPENMTLERRRLLAAHGAEIVLTPASQGMRGAVQKAEELASKHKHVMLQQFKNAANPEAHRRTTAPEILSSLTGISIDGFVACVGTGGTITGVGEVLRGHFPDMLIAAVEPKDSAVLSGGEPGPHKIQGMGAGFIPPILNTKVYDEVIKVAEDAAFAATRLLAKKAGLLVGLSSGAALDASIKVAKKLGPGKNVVTILPDTGERYLSTGVFD